MMILLRDLGGIGRCTNDSYTINYQRTPRTKSHYICKFRQTFWPFDELFQTSIAVAFHFIHSFLDECHMPAIFASLFSCTTQFALLMLAIDYYLSEIHTFAFLPMMSLCSSAIRFTLHTFYVSHSFLDEWKRFLLPPMV